MCGVRVAEKQQKQQKTQQTQQKRNMLHLIRSQIFFLTNGGPKNDYHNIDADGDGFACKWDPSIYRKIDALSENKEIND